MSPTCGGVGRLVFIGGEALVGCEGALPAGTIVVWFPDKANAAYTFVPFVLTASARGFSPCTVMFVTRLCVVASNTAIRFLREALTNARPPANATSAGSSFTYIVSVTIR